MTPKVVHARDRIGTGPWYNAKGVLIAKNVEDLHAAKSNVTKETALDEKGQPVNDRSMKPNKHDILTGSRPDGTAFAGSPIFDMTCGNWTKGGTEGSAMVGHHDRDGPIDHAWATSWNSSHPTRGCTQENSRQHRRRCAVLLFCGEVTKSLAQNGNGGGEARCLSRRLAQRLKIRLRQGVQELD